MVDVAVAQAQGPRDHMEDFVRFEQGFLGHEERLYVGVFDGHGGDAVSRAAASQFHKVLAAELDRGGSEREAIGRAFRTFDDSVAEETGGAVAAVVLLDKDAAWVANVGDVTVLLVSRHEERILTADHRLTNETEYARVKSAGAIVRFPYAFLPGGEGLMPTRSLGDREFRAIGILAVPEIASVRLSADDIWLVAGTDGVFDPLEPAAVARLARAATTARLAAERILKAALAAGDDNVSVVAIRR
ncbi:MAG: protein serine/threonine phosphatase 2C family protein [Methanobacteriota archaeon]|nr:MAG: protein serine/threonine phosphatase 2C family protein [Euryarchaeota archaeon]